jgi:trk system potassium uptake protein TrkA
MKRDMVASLATGMATTGSDQIALGDGHWMREMSVPGSFVGRSLRELDVRGRWGVQIVLVRRPAQGRDSEAIELVPGPQARLRLADQIVFVGPQDALDRLEGA